MTRLSCLLIALSTFLSPSVASAEPYLPSDESQVLERLPEAPASALRQRLSQDPTNLGLAVELAQSYISAARAEGDPRYNGYAQAALSPWWQDAAPPIPVLVLRATLRQNRHDFAAALADLDQVLARRPDHSQARLTRAVILQVQGRYGEAATSCRYLRGLVAATCAAESASLSGRLDDSYEALRRAFQSAGSSAPPEIRLWGQTVLAEMAERRGDGQSAERHFRTALALGLPDAYLIGAYSDFLLAQDRADEVLDLIPEAPRPDGLLLRRALAERALGRPPMLAALEARFAASRRRGDSAHQRAEARYRLDLLGHAEAALTLARDTWRVQREPWDARLLLRAALAAGRPEAAREVLAWLEATGLEDVRLAALAARLKAPAS
ncbi:MAG: hypothetical protein AAF495_21905 [Pseudomonadota bacterium]